MKKTSNENQNLASLYKRAFSIILDMILYYFILVPPVYVISLNFINLNATVIQNEIIVYLFLGLAYILFLLKDSIRGASIGKWITGIMVRKDGSLDKIPDVMELFIRNMLLLIFPIEAFSVIINQNRKRQGDYLTKTVVCENPNREKLGFRIFIFLFLMFCAFEVTFYFAYYMFSKFAM